MKKPKSMKIRIPVWYIAQFTLLFLLPVICRIYRFSGKTVAPLDKKNTHSFPGIFLIFGILAVFTGIFCCCYCILTESRYSFTLTGIFLLGILLGMVLHLFADLCTRKGLVLFYPFNTLIIYGSIRPCNTEDPRIRRYILCNAAVLVLLITIRIFFKGSYPSVATGILGFLICQGLMIAQSDLEHSENSRDPAKIPIARRENTGF